MHSIAAELAEHAHKLDVELQNLWEWFFSVCCAHACHALPLTSELVNNTLRNLRNVLLE